jgi:hypothetical protein
MLAPGKFAQPFDSAIFFGLPSFMIETLTFSAPTLVLKIVGRNVKSMPVLAEDFDFVPGRNVTCGQKGATALFYDFLDALEKVVLGRTRFPAAVLASMLKLALSANGS